MLFNKAILVFLLLTTSLFSQNIGTWKNFTNMDDVMGISSTSDGFWIATTGGAGYFSNSANNFELFLTNSEGLSNQNITALEIASLFKL